MSRRLFLVWLVGAAACASPAPPEGRPRVGEAQVRAEAAQRPVLAEATNRTPPLHVQVLDARVAADTLRIEVVVSNTAAAGTTASELVAVGQAVAGLGGMSVMGGDGQRRVFPLHDGAGKMAWSGLEPPPPGQRRSFWVLFPRPDERSDRVTLVLPGLAPLPGIPVSK